MPTESVAVVRPGSSNGDAARPARVLLFWDYDTQWGADRSRESAGRADWGRLEFEFTERILELLQRYEVPACFAVVGSAALPGTRPYHDPSQVRQIHAAGHEVASHSHRHEWLPALGREALRETLSRSKEALEQCIGSVVTSFVPPWNQPFDYPAGWSFSLSERRQAKGERTDLRRLCETLRETGYDFCRVAYRSLYQQLAHRLGKRRYEHTGPPEVIEGIACVRLSTEAGFGPDALRVLERCIERRSLAILYGHPHSLQGGDGQHERCLEPFLARLQELRSRGAVQVVRPRDLMNGAKGAF